MKNTTESTSNLSAARYSFHHLETSKIDYSLRHRVGHAIHRPKTRTRRPILLHTMHRCLDLSHSAENCTLWRETIFRKSCILGYYSGFLWKKGSDLSQKVNSHLKEPQSTAVRKSDGRYSIKTTSCLQRSTTFACKTAEEFPKAFCRNHRFTVTLHDECRRGCMMPPL
jgi:hypothetical protein